MYDQSFNANSLARELRKSDFIKNKRLRDPKFREAQIELAVQRAVTGFQHHTLLSASDLKGKPVFSIKSFADELVLRKISRNIIRISRIKYPNRDQLVSNIKNMISEGVSYRVYRLDLKSFYESISTELATHSIDQLSHLNIPTRRYVNEILSNHRTQGYPGLPRGLGLSAVLAELILKDFDKMASTINGVYYYGRFVDDILIITSFSGEEKTLISKIKKLLPTGLLLNSSKQSIEFAKNNVDPFKPPASAKRVLNFEFLGYKFTVYEPIQEKKNKPGSHFRDVCLDIADSKVNKIKTRIVRSLLAFIENKDYDLLELRLKYLTSNFSVTDAERQQKRLAGIYHNYWLTDPDRSSALPILDSFLRKAIISSNGIVFEKFFISSTHLQRRGLLKNSFTRGFKNKTYLHFPKEVLSDIQRCWDYA